MNGRVKWLVLALGAAFALASAGCAGEPSDDDDVAAAVQMLDSIDEQDGDGSGENDQADSGDGAAATDGETLEGDESAEDVVSGPDPIPWTEHTFVNDDGDPSSPHTSMAHTGSGAPSTGNGGK